MSFCHKAGKDSECTTTKAFRHVNTTVPSILYLFLPSVLPSRQITFAIHTQVSSEVVSPRENLELTCERIQQDCQTFDHGDVGPGTQGDMDDRNEASSQRKAAGCFKRQLFLLKSLDRLSAPVPHLDPKVR